MRINIATLTATAKSTAPGAANSATIGTASSTSVTTRFDHGSEAH
jgi:hypothetical protein